MEEKESKMGLDSGLASAVLAIKGAILQSQQRALRAVNQEQLALYYGIGRYVSANTRKKNWGKGAIETISEQLRKELPGLKGFSARNIKNMRTFYEEWNFLEKDNLAVQTAEFTEINRNSSVRTDELTNISAVRTAELTDESEIRSLERINLSDFSAVAFLSISFTHHTAILTHVKTYEERKFYIQYAANKKFVEYVIQDYDKPMGVATYKTSADMNEKMKKLLPPVEELEKLL